ncbi:MAG: hypothetical protein M1825_003738 [Sarcosagium campestre]|nr:MAG: hypothetical protein M1825_003738 [Sarcosagium campestre]
MRTDQSLLTCLSAGLLFASLTWAQNTTLKVGAYWGQGADQKRLGNLCQSSSIDIIPIAFINVFPAQGIAGYPGSNFGNGCGDAKVKGPNGVDTQLQSSCTEIAEDIPICQRLGKKVLLSLGGSVGNYSIPDDASAVTFADFLWAAFGPQQANPGQRPFGSATIDGFDLNIEQGTQVGYRALAVRLKDLYNTDPSRQYYLSASPQCVVPDAFLADAIQNAYFDYIFIQFYNTSGCSARDYLVSQPAPTTFEQYAAAIPKWPNPKALIFVGLPGSTASTNDPKYYLPPNGDLERFVTTVQSKFPASFGGIMIWDATSAQNNVVDGKNYLDWSRQTLNRISGNTSSTASSSTSTSTSTSTASSGSATGSPVGGCPGSNSQVYTASDNSRYQIQCNTEYPNVGQVVSSRQDTFAQCIQQCVVANQRQDIADCAGCSFRPTGSGDNCFLKSQIAAGSGQANSFPAESAVLLPGGVTPPQYIQPNGGNLVVDRRPTSSASPTTQSPPISSGVAIVQSSSSSSASSVLPPGPSGAAGNPGNPGDSGSGSGSPGVSGASGTSEASGSSGASGASGASVSSIVSNSGFTGYWNNTSTAGKGPVIVVPRPQAAPKPAAAGSPGPVVYASSEKGSGCHECEVEQKNNAQVPGFPSSGNGIIVIAPPVILTNGTYGNGTYTNATVVVIISVTYVDVCPEGLTTKTYQIKTSSRRGQHPKPGSPQVQSQPPIPKGWNKVVKVCDKCGPTPQKVTLTLPPKTITTTHTNTVTSTIYPSTGSNGPAPIAAGPGPANTGSPSLPESPASPVSPPTGEEAPLPISGGEEVPPSPLYPLEGNNTFITLPSGSAGAAPLAADFRGGATATLSVQVGVSISVALLGCLSILFV